MTSAMSIVRALFFSALVTIPFPNGINFVAHVRPSQKQCLFYWHISLAYAIRIKCHRVHSHCMYFLFIAFLHTHIE